MFLILLLACGLANAQPVKPLPLIPYPASLVRHDGSFPITAETRIRILHRDLEPDARIFADEVERTNGLRLTLTIGGEAGRGEIVLDPPDTSMAKEAYTLHIDNEGIRARGGPSGLFYALQTLRQLIGPERKSRFDLSSLDIQDAPRYAWRGMHLDVCRHFFPVDFIKRYIDELAMYKMNTFHWHLTDDQGWRIEIKRYPQLTEISSVRKGSMIGPYNAQQFDTVRYGGYYTQDQIRDVVAYASERHVTIVPEIEMPGHSLAALAAFPQLSCTGGPFEVAKGWGVFDDIFCTKDETFEFLENVLSEVCDLFPGPVIHIGGDEAPKVRWKVCPHCQALIKKEGLHGEEELQSYFTRQIEEFLASKGKQLIGWDEILEGGVAPNALVMSWRGTDGGVAAARQHHGVVMTPGGYCYFDYYQGDPSFEPLAIGGFTPVEKTYSFEPTPAELAPSERKYILGAQGNVWTEYITTPEHVEYMAHPRMAALAEVVWSPDSVRNLAAFQERLFQHFAMLDSLRITYAKSIFEIKPSLAPLADRRGVSLRLASPFTTGAIHCTTDGSEPSVSSPTYADPIDIRKSGTVRFAYFKDGKKVGNTLAETFHVSTSTGKSIRLKDPPHQNYFGDGAFTLVNGLFGDTAHHGTRWVGWWGKDMDATIDLDTVAPLSRVSVNFYEDEASWIALPARADLYVGNDTLHMTKVATYTAEEMRKDGRRLRVTLAGERARFVRVLAVNAGKIADGKPGAGNDAWLFADEIVVE